MREVPTEKVIFYASCIAVVVASTLLFHRVPRTRGRQPLYHALFLLVVVLSLVLIPSWVQDELFSPGGVLVLGTVMPIYESIVAVCSIEEADDVAWLQFWIAAGSFSFATEFMDEITAYLPQAGEHWYEFEFFFTLWLLLPVTDGSRLVFDVVTKPYLAPVLETCKAKLEGWASLLLAAVNTSYLWLLWFVFTTLPEEARRFFVVALGTIYPLIASTVVLSTTTRTRQERFWLVYWSTYSVLFIFMDYLENFVGHIRGFYSICAVATLWLFLPMFLGAESVFRNVLVPLTGQYENLMLYDAYLVKLQVEQSIPEASRKSVMQKAADIFVKEETDKKTL